MRPLAELIAENLQKPRIGHIKPYSRTNYCFFIGTQKLNRVAFKYMDL